jgi:hypothetical protein
MGITIMLYVLCVKKTIALMINGGVGEWLGRSNGGRGTEWARDRILSTPAHHHLGHWEWEKNGLSGFSLGRRRFVRVRLARLLWEGRHSSLANNRSLGGIELMQHHQQGGSWEGRPTDTIKKTIRSLCFFPVHHR